MTRVYLYPRARMLEMLAALFAFGFGAHVAVILWRGDEPLSWAGLALADQSRFAWAVIAASLAHAIGIEANGRLGPISPALRALGLTFQAVLFGWLAFAGIAQTAAYTYGWITLLLGIGAHNAICDLSRAIHDRKATRPWIL